MKTHISLISFISVLVSMAQPAWAMEEQYQDAEYNGQKQPEKKKEKETEGGEVSFDSLSKYPLRYMEKRKSIFRKQPGFENVWEKLDLLDAAKKGILTQAEKDHLIRLVAMDFFPNKILRGIDFTDLLMSQPPEKWSDDRIITAVLKLRYFHIPNYREVSLQFSEDRDMESLFARVSEICAPESLRLVHEYFPQIVQKIQARADSGDAQAQFILYLMHTKQWGISPQHNSLTGEEMTDEAQNYLRLAVEQMCPFALYTVLKNYHKNAEEIELVDSQINEESDEYEVKKYTEYLLVEFEKHKESWSKARTKVTEGVENDLFDPMTKAHLLSFGDEEHQAESAAHGDFRALRRLGRIETINPTHAPYYMLGHKVGFKTSTQKLAKMYMGVFEGQSRTLAEKKERFKRAIKYAYKAYAADKFNDTSMNDLFLQEHFSHPPLESQKTQAQSLPTESVSPLEPFEEVIAQVGYLKGVHASTYKDSIQNEYLANSAGIVLDILNKYKNFFEKLNHTPGLLIPGEFHYHYELHTLVEPATGRSIDSLVVVPSVGKVHYKDSISYTIKGEKYTSTVWKKYHDLLLPTVLEANQKVLQEEFKILLKYNRQALALLKEEKVGLSESLLTLKLLSGYEEPGKSLYSYLSPFLGDHFTELSTEEMEKTKAKAIESTEAIEANLESHIDFINNFQAYYLNSIAQMRSHLQIMFMGTFDFMYGDFDKEL